MKTAILFDLDGTLLDTLGDLHAAVNHALCAFGYPQRSLEEVRQFVGNGAGRLIARSVPEGANPAPVLTEFQKYYGENCRNLTRPYPGIREALAVLGEQYPLAIVSNKPDFAVKALCADFFPGIFALGERQDIPRKPAPDMVLAAMAHLGVQTCIYVGDSEVDIVTARAAQVPCLSVTWGFRDGETLICAGGSHFCDSPAEFTRSIEEIIHGQ